MWLWYLDRGSALAAYVLLWLAAITGVLHGARGFGGLHEAARKAHVSVSVLASAALLLHVAVGFYDASLVVAGSVPHPPYSDAHFAMGLVVGVGALMLIVTSVLGFVDAKRFERPWDPRTVHAFAYGGFAFATVHAVAIGTDVVGLAFPALIAASIFLVYLLVLRARSARATAKGGGPTAAVAAGAVPRRRE